MTSFITTVNQRNAGGGSLRKVVKLPEGEDENEWLAVNMVDFYNHINLLYGSITEFCSPQSCPEMKATDECLHQLTLNILMAWVQASIDNETVFPSRIGVPFPKGFSTMIKQVFKRMYRVRTLLRAQKAAGAPRVLTQAVRNYAAPAAVDSKPPVALYGVDGTYASALYTAAAKTSTLRQRGPLPPIPQQHLPKKTPSSQPFCKHPLSPCPTNRRSSRSFRNIPVVRTRVDTVKNFLETLAEKQQIGTFEGVELVITSASQLDSRTLSRLETAVSKSQYVGQGKKLKVTNKVNPDLLGGLIVEIGADRTIDLSVSNRIAKLNKLLTDAL
ncbi:hypothetical protein EYC84_000849 [Monilinia fructicola]|uniref:Uncharacterized protein n=1 Tax=Monilinia fructicola TaxID=38448 RepID=A0A5M9JKJ2_MONFR|nr:hypothetical protein EYC84_000849 [Monilinia fructicola]